MDERVRAQNVGLSIVSLAQGVPFMQAGSDLLRSKSLDRDSYNSGDWFNKLDFTYQDNNWGVGLPPAAVGGQSDNWPVMAPLLGNPDLKPTHTDILSSAHHLQDMLAIRKSTPLFRLETQAEIQQRLAFHNTGPAQIPGLIVMSLSDMDGALHSPYSLVVVLFNANDEAQTFTEAALIGADLELHPVQVNGYDPVVKTATFNPATGAFSVPARTTAVFVLAAQDIVVTPLALSVTLDTGMTTSQVLTVSNLGGVNLVWQLLESPDVPWLTVDWETVVGLPVRTPPGEVDTALALFDAAGLLPGVYTTTLTVSSNDPDEPAISIPVTLTVPCEAAAITSLTSDSPVMLDETLHFTATVSGSTPITYTWDFDGAGTQGGTDANPTFLYAAAGTYTVTLIVENDCGTDMETLVVTVVAEPCEAAAITSLTSDSPVMLGETLHFTATATGTAPFVYTWDFGGAGTRGGTDTHPTFAYTAAGMYTVTLTVNNACGADTETLVVTVEEEPCDVPAITSLTSDSPVMLGETLHFTATATGTAPLDYIWDFGGAGTLGGTDANPTFLYAAAGTYTVTLIAENDCGTDMETLVVTVVAEPCEAAAITSLISDSPVMLGETLHFTTTVAGTAPFVYTWDFGGAGTRGGTDANPTFLYAAAGEYTVTLTVNNACGADMETLVVTVTPSTYKIFLPLVMH